MTSTPVGAPDGSRIALIDARNQRETLSMGSGISRSTSSAVSVAARIASMIAGAASGIRSATDCPTPEAGWSLPDAQLAYRTVPLRSSSAM